jgi:uncharacterized protein (TIGR00369 family)
MAYLPNSETCYVCGRDNPFGLKVRFRWVNGEVQTTFIADEHRCSYKGVVHGGVLSSLLDETMGWAPAFHKKLFCSTAELKIRFLQPAPVERLLIVTGRMTEDRKRIWEAEGEVRGDDGTVYAKGWGKYVPMTPEQTLEVIEYLNFDEETVPATELLPSTTD